MQDLLPHAELVAARLVERGESLAVAESSVGGLISAALLSLPGASRFFLGGAILYTREARRALLGITDEMMTGIRPSTEAYALLVARTGRQRFGADWCLAETGASGPTGNRYGDPAGHACLAVAGGTEVAITLETGSTDRAANMRAFAVAALTLLADNLG